MLLNVNQADESEEKEAQNLAWVMLELYGRKTSVMYDVATIIEMILSKPNDDQEQDDNKLVLLANILNLSIQQVYHYRDNKCPQKDHQTSFNEYLNLAKSHLSLSSLIKILQPHRDNLNIVEPVLKILFISLQIANQQDSSTEENLICDDTMKTLRQFIAKDHRNQSVVRLSVINLVKIKDKYPQQRQKCLDILKEIMGE